MTALPAVRAVRRCGYAPAVVLLAAVSVSPLLSQESAPAARRVRDVSVTNVFYESDLLQVLVDISAQTRVPIITDGQVGGVVTVELVEVTLPEALSRILHPLGFAFRDMGEYFLVGSARTDGPAFSQLAESEVLTPNYLRAEEAHTLMPDCFRPYLKLDKTSNTLTATAPPEMLKSIRRHLAGIDKQKKQVLIEALITEISDNATKSFGVDWSGTFWQGADTLLSGGTQLGTGTADTGIALVVRRLTGGLGDLSYSVIPTINALVQDGKASIRANPRIVTVSGQSAEIVVGKEQYYTIVAGSEAYPYTRLEQIDVGVSMVITPYVSDGGDITVQVEPTVSDVIGSGFNQLPTVSKRSAKTKVVVKDGESIVIGGLLMRSEQTVRRKIPLLGDIPILGLLFSHTTKVIGDNEVVVVVTPKVLE
ncbi:MAG: type II secretion system protein GspD [candidate division WOR-3 bacterium]|nr:MAG: type II secretion system protein GspD [candidate division WOR-3 bacterium]